MIDLWPKDAETACYADMTRTFCIGEIPDELREYHRLVKESLDRSLEAVRAGAKGPDVYAVSCEPFHRERLQDAAEQGAGRGRSRTATSTRSATASASKSTSSRGSRAPARRCSRATSSRSSPASTAAAGAAAGSRISSLVTDDGAENLTDYPYDLEP